MTASRSIDLPDGPAGRSQPARGPGWLLIDLDRHFEGGDLADLRASLAALVGAYTTDRHQIDILLLIASELATNAVRHGGGRGRLQVWRHGAALCCRVSDNGPGLAAAEIGRHRPPLTATGGRGLWICRRLARLMYVHPGRNGVGAVVTAVVAAGVQGADRLPVATGLVPASAALAERTRELADTSRHLCRRAAAATEAAREIARRRSARSRVMLAATD